MLRKLSQRIDGGQRGFTLIELLVVILIIGILAAIALPAFLGQQKKGQDADAKSQARNMVSQVETCATDTGGVYTSCQNPPNTGLNVGSGQGQVEVTVVSSSGYTIVAHSKSGINYTITKDPTTGATTRTCSSAGNGGCKTADAQGNMW